MNFNCADHLTLKAGYLPGIDENDVSWETLEYKHHGVASLVQVPVLSAIQYEALANRVQTLGLKQMQSISTTEIVNAIDQVVTNLLDVQSQTMKLALTVLPQVTGFDPEMMRLTLHDYLKSFKLIALKRFLAQDFANPQVLEDFVPNVNGGLTRAIPPSLILHSWSGNVPALALWSLISSLLVKAPSIGKVSSAEPLFVSWFVRLLVKALPQIKDALAIVWWRGGDHANCQPLLNAAQLVVAYGSDQSLHNLKKNLPQSTRFLGFGHKLSFALLSQRSMNRALIADCVSKAAWDVIAHDKAGCYSPHVFFVQKGGAISPQEFAQLLMTELKSQSVRFPSGASDLSDKSIQESWLQSKRFESIQSQGVQVLGGLSSSSAQQSVWVIFHENLIDLSPSPPKRIVQVVAFETWNQVVESLGKVKKYLQTAGLALSHDEIKAVVPMLASAGVTRFTAIGSMSSPEPGWHHDGRFGLLDLVSMVDIESSAISSAEIYNDYRI
jgi:hypothetical protein